MANNIFENGIAEIFGTKNQAVETLVVNNEVLNKMATKMEDPECIIEVTVSTSSKNLPIMEVRISKGQGSTSEWTYATDEVIIRTVKAFCTQTPELLKTKDEIKVAAVENNLQFELAAAFIVNRCRYNYVAYKNREEVDCYMITFFLAKNRRFKVSLVKDDNTTKLINA